MMKLTQGISSSECLTETKKKVHVIWHYCIHILRFCMESHWNLIIFKLTRC